MWVRWLEYCMIIIWVYLIEHKEILSHKINKELFKLDQKSKVKNTISYINS